MSGKAKAIVEVGGRFGKWTVLKELEERRHRAVQVLARCDCGTEAVIRYTVLRHGRSKGCPRCAGRRDPEPRVGQVFGKWTVIGAVIKVDRRKRCLCRCECGAERLLLMQSLNSGASTQCRSCQSRGNTTRRTHNRTRTTEHNIWCAMRRRCNKPQTQTYRRYGGRGIRVCDEWNAPRTGFQAFFRDMGARPSAEHTLERVDNDGDYTPENCRWATRTEQARNRSTSALVEIDGETKTIAEWCEEAGIPQYLFHNRTKVLGWEPRRALCTPARKFTKRSA